MDENAVVFKSGVESLMDLVKTVFQDRFNAYYEGDPGQIPLNAFPCCIIEKTQGEIREHNTAQDMLIEVVSIRFVLDKQEDLGQLDDVDLTERRLRRMIEARDPVTGRYAQGTLMYELRKRQSLNQLTIEHNENITYGVVDRSDMFSSEARIDVTLTELVYREPDVN